MYICPKPVRFLLTECLANRQPFKRDESSILKPSQTGHGFQLLFPGPCALPTPLQSLYKPLDSTPSSFPISCARACTVASEVFTEAQSFADCKLHIRTRLLCFGLQQFLETSLSLVVFVLCLVQGWCTVCLYTRELHKA